MTLTKWPSFMLLLSLLTLIGIFSFILASKNLAVNPSQANPAVFLFVPQQKAGGITEISVNLQSSLQDISAFTLKVNYLGRSIITINPHPQLQKEGWLFPVAKIKNQEIELAGIFVQPETYSFSQPKAVAVITLENEKFDQANFQIDPDLTYVTSRHYQSLTPDIQWQTI